MYHNILCNMEQQFNYLSHSSVLLSSRPGLGHEDPRGHLMKVLALALRKKSLGLGLTKAKAKNFPQRSRPRGKSAHTHGVT